MSDHMTRRRLIAELRELSGEKSPQESPLDSLTLVRERLAELRGENSQDDPDEEDDDEPNMWRIKRK